LKGRHEVGVVRPRRAHDVHERAADVLRDADLLAHGREKALHGRRVLLAGRPRDRRLREEHRRVAFVGARREAPHEDAHAREPIDERVVDLEVDRDPPALEPFDEVHLPGGTVEVEWVAVEARDENAELALVAGRRQGGAAHVVLEVEGLVLDPALQRAREKVRVAELEVPRRVDRRLAPQFVHELPLEVARPVLGRRERHERADVHHGFARLAREEGAIEGVQWVARRHSDERNADGSRQPNGVRLRRRAGDDGRPPARCRGRPRR
jgi:hypothetical protein